MFYACGRFESDDPVWKNGAIPGYTSPTLQRAQATMRALWAEYKSKLSVFKEISAVAARVSRAGSNHPSAQSDVDASLALASAKHSELAQTHEAAPAAESAVEQEFVQLINAYRSAAAAAARCSDPSTVLDILRTCEYDGIPQDSVIYGAFVAALAINGDRVGANEKFREMFTLGLQPGVAVYAALARAAARALEAAHEGLGRLAPRARARSRARGHGAAHKGAGADQFKRRRRRVYDASKENRAESPGDYRDKLPESLELSLAEALRDLGEGTVQ